MSDIYEFSPLWDEWEIDQNGFYQGKDFGKEYAGTIGTAYGWIVKRYQLTQSLIDTLKICVFYYMQMLPQLFVFVFVFLRYQ